MDSDPAWDPAWDKDFPDYVPLPTNPHPDDSSDGLPASTHVDSSSPFRSDELDQSLPVPGSDLQPLGNIMGAESNPQAAIPPAMDPQESSQTPSNLPSKSLDRMANERHDPKQPWSWEDFLECVPHISLSRWGLVGRPSEPEQALDIVLATFDQKPRLFEDVTARINDVQSKNLVSVRKYLGDVFIRCRLDKPSIQESLFLPGDAARNFLGIRQPRTNSKGMQLAEGGHVYSWHSDGSGDESEGTEPSNADILTSHYVVNLQAWGEASIRPSDTAAAIELAIRCVTPSKLRHVRNIQQKIDTIEWHLGRNPHQPFDILLAVRYNFFVPNHRYFNDDLQKRWGKPTDKDPAERCDDKWFIKALGGQGLGSDNESDSDDEETSLESLQRLPKAVRKLQERAASTLTFRERRLVEIWKTIIDNDDNHNGSNTGDESETNTSCEDTEEDSPAQNTDLETSFHGRKPELKPLDFEPTSQQDPSRMDQDKLYVEEGFWTRPLNPEEEQLYAALRTERYGDAQPPGKAVIQSLQKPSQATLSLNPQLQAFEKPSTSSLVPHLQSLQKPSQATLSLNPQLQALEKSSTSSLVPHLQASEKTSRTMASWTIEDRDSESHTSQFPPQDDLADGSLALQNQASDQNSGTKNPVTKEPHTMLVLKSKTDASTTTDPATKKKRKTSSSKTPIHPIQAEQDLKSREKINNVCKQSLDHFEKKPYTTTEDPPSSGKDPIGGKKASVKGYIELGYQLWNVSTQEDFEAYPELKNVYLSDPGVVFAYTGLSTTERSTRFCSDFGENGQIRRNRVPKGPAVLVQDADETLYYVVVECTYVLKGSHGLLETNPWWLVSPGEASDSVSDKKPPFSWGNVPLPGGFYETITKNRYVVMSHTDAESHPYFWKDTTPYQYATTSEDAPSEQATPKGKRRPSTRLPVSQDSKLGGYNVVPPVKIELTGPERRRSSPGATLLTPAFQPTEDTDRTVDTLTQGLRATLTTLLGANSESYVRERMASSVTGKDDEISTASQPLAPKKRRSDMGDLPDYGPRRTKMRRSESRSTAGLSFRDPASTAQRQLPPAPQSYAYPTTPGIPQTQSMFQVPAGMSLVYTPQPVPYYQQPYGQTSGLPAPGQQQGQAFLPLQQPPAPPEPPFDSGPRQARRNRPALVRARDEFTGSHDRYKRNESPRRKYHQDDSQAESADEEYYYDP